jgi:hypothetical protein
MEPGDRLGYYILKPRGYYPDQIEEALGTGRENCFDWLADVQG